MMLSEKKRHLTIVSPTTSITLLSSSRLPFLGRYRVLLHGWSTTMNMWSFDSFISFYIQRVTLSLSLSFLLQSDRRTHNDTPDLDKWNFNWISISGKWWYSTNFQLRQTVKEKPTVRSLMNHDSFLSQAPRSDRFFFFFLFFFAPFYTHISDTTDLFAVVHNGCHSFYLELYTRRFLFTIEVAVDFKWCFSFGSKTSYEPLDSI